MFRIFLVLSFMVSLVSSLSNGVNLQPSYYGNEGAVTFGWSLMHSEPRIKSLRIEIEPDRVEQAKDWIKQAHTNGYSIIATYHKCSVLGTDDSGELQEAATWWVTNYASLKAYGDFTINIMNEWGSHSQTADSYSSAYNSAISTIRTVYPKDRQLIADIPGWGQETHTAAQASPKIHDVNVTFSAHVYPGSWNSAYNRYMQPSDIDELQATGRPCVVGEFGTVGSGGTDVTAIISHAKQLGLAVLGWAWNGDGGDMNMVTPAWYQDATAAAYSLTQYGQQIVSML
jgi:mannan endo-1,4-beta-mannosidase